MKEKKEKRTCVNIKMRKPIYLTDEELSTLEIDFTVKVNGKIVSNSVAISKVKGKNKHYTLSTIKN